MHRVMWCGGDDELECRSDWLSIGYPHVRTADLDLIDNPPRLKLRPVVDDAVIQDREAESG